MVAKKSTSKNSQVATPAKTKHTRAHQIVLSSNVLNAAGIAEWSKFAGDIDLVELIADLGNQTVLVQEGDMRPVEGMLYRQAKTLETMFVVLARRAACNENLKPYQINLQLALKCQAQCRATLEALAEIKNPRPVSFVKQSNVTSGPQQVNNYAGTQSHNGIQSGAGNFQSEQNKLLEVDHGQRMDIGAQEEASRVNQTVEAVG